MATTADCKKFLVDQAKVREIDPEWCYERDTIRDDIKFEHDVSGMTETEIDQLVNRLYHEKKAHVFNALTNPKNWKRRAKYKDEDDDSVIVREFMCDTLDNLFDGQVGYRVLEMADGSLVLGDDIGD